MLKRLVLWGVLAITGTCSVLAQSEQTTKITKILSDNPTLGIVQFEGPQEARQQLEKALQFCGWFRVLAEKDAGQAQFKLQVRHRNTPRNAYDARVIPGGGEGFFCSGSAEELNLASFMLVDEILQKQFRVPALCTRKIVFVMPGQDNLKELYSCYLDGSAQERLTHNGAISTEPDWGHQKALVYTMARKNSLSVVLMDTVQKRQRVVSHSKGLNASASLSPTGQFLALALSQDRRVDLYVKNLSDNSMRRLTSDVSVESSPCWSPDGQTICYVSDKLGRPQLYLVSVSGGSGKRLSLGGTECVSPDWSPVSNKICYSNRNNAGQYVICVLDMDGKDRSSRTVTLAAGNWEAPSWAPDGRHIVCIRSTGRSRDLYIVDSWLNSFRALSQGANLSLPAWAPAH
ncbi:MAG: hypothetical protein GX564_08580 [Oligosphaeraceae bacterium]|nr:hypothetical protein [Oligosphaeraceae bacterium]